MSKPGNFNVYVGRLLSKLDKEARISGLARKEVSQIMSFVGHCIASKANSLAAGARRKTISLEDIYIASSYLLGSVSPSKGRLEQRAVNAKKGEGDLAKRAKLTVTGGEELKALIIPPSRAARLIREYKRRMSADSAIALAACIQAVAVKLLKNAIVFAKDRKQLTITPGDLESVVRSLKVMCDIFERCNIEVSAHVRNVYDPGYLKKGVKKPSGRGEIRRRGKETNITYIPRSRFHAFARKEAKKVGIDGMTADASASLQLYLEKCAVDTLEDANMHAMHAKRVTVYPKDFALATREKTKC